MAHCIRLLRMGNEILLTGKVNVNRTLIDGSFLLNIRQGNIPYHLVEELADSLFTELETSYKHSKLPKSVDVNKIDNLLINIVEDYHATSH